jgi:hypothetical protein
LIIGFNVRKFDLPDFFSDSYQSDCKSLWIVGYAGNHLKEPNVFASDASFKECRVTQQLGRYIDFKPMLVDIVNKYRTNFRHFTRIFLLFSFEDCDQPYPVSLPKCILDHLHFQLSFYALREVNYQLEQMGALEKIAVFSYNQDTSYDVSAAGNMEPGRVVSIRKFFGPMYSSLDIRMVGASVNNNLYINRFCSMRIEMNVDVHELAELLFSLNFCRQTLDYQSSPLPAPIHLAKETAKRAAQLFHSYV